MLTDQAKEVYTWHSVPPENLAEWNDKLALTDASFRQYPFWGEASRHVNFHPLYAVCRKGEETYAFVCVLTVRMLSMRIGLVEKGPVCLEANEGIDPRALEALRGWAEHLGLTFLRFICQPDLGEMLVTAGAVKKDFFPLYGGVSLCEMRVKLQEDESAMLAGFQSTTRRQIKTAKAAGYSFRKSSRAKDLLDYWRLVEIMASRKGLAFARPVEAWMEVLNAGGPLGKASLYIADYHETPVQMILVVRDAETAEYLIGALDVKFVEDKPSPSCLLHWTAMRDALTCGCKHYDLGHPAGPVVQFKRRFRPEERWSLGTYTLPCKTLSCHLWSKGVLQVMLPLWPTMKPIISGVLRSRARAVR